MANDKGVVVPFEPPSPLVLSAFEGQARQARILDYDEARRVYAPQLRGYWGDNKQQHRVFGTALDAAWDELKERGVAADVITAFRHSEAYNKALQNRERWFERGAYMLGLWVARREYPRLCMNGGAHGRR